MKKINTISTTKKTILSTALLLLLLPASAYSAVTIFTDRASWESALTNPILFEDFSSIPGFVPLVEGSNVAGLLDIHITGTPSGNNFVYGVFGGSSQAFNGVKFNTIELRFPSNVTAFGMDVSQISSAGLSIRYGSNLTSVSEGFFGIIDTAANYGSIEFECTTCLDAGSTMGSVIYNIDNVSFVEQINSLSLFPGSGKLVSTTKFDLTLIAEAPGLTATVTNVIWNGTNITTPFNNCAITGSLTEGGTTFRCSGLSGSNLGNGIHDISATIDLSDGSQLTNSVIWEVKGNTEP